MTYAFRKYLNKRGSALFMVLSLMTALMILVMAMYFSVVASRDVQYKVFYQEQAYRSATSLSDAIVAGLKGDSWQTGENSDKLLTAITNMGEDDVITTNGNDFKAFLADAGSKEDQDQLGAYTVTITRMKDETINNETTRVYDVAITTSSGGVLDTTHTFIHVVEPEGEATQGKTNIFTSTGYVPNDVHLDTVETWTDLFYDNEYVVITGESHIYSNLSCGGSLNLDQCSASPGKRNGSDSSYNKPATWAIRNHFTNSTGTTLCMSPSSTDRGLILVGGDLTIEGNFDNADIYVLGNAYYKGGNLNNCRVFINGELRSVGNASPPGFTFYASGKDENISIHASGVWKTMSEADLKANNIMSVSEMAKKLDELTASNDYAKWEINDDAPKKDYYVSCLDPASNDYIGEETIEFDPDHRTYYLDWKSGYTIKDYFGKGQDLNYSPYVIGDIKADWNKEDAENKVNGNTNFATIVIDTGDNEDNQVFLKINANRNFDLDSGDETFTWLPEDIGESSTAGMTVLVRGKGNVVIDVPEGVIYQASDNTSVMHETWYAILGGSVDQYGSTRETLCFRQKYGTADGFLKDPTVTLNFVHTDCNEDCDVCKYTTKTTGTDKCSECGKNVTEVICDEHKMTYTFCLECNPELEPSKNSSGYYGLCANRVERSAVASAVGNLDSTWQSLLKESGDGTTWYYPNTNIFLVSCDESADIRLAYDQDGAAFSNSSFWGFVYAPYMTYKGMGNGSGWTVFGGGMIVADYIIKNFDIYIACYPDQLPEDLMNEKNRSEMLDAIASKSWKISLAGY